MSETDTTFSRRKVYLDHSATTPADARVVQAMLPYLTEKFGNASSVHYFGQQARAAVDRARRQVAALIGARANEIIFLSGGTEANNLAIRGLCEAAEPHGRHIITSRIEHPSVAGVCEAMENRGWEVTRLPVYDQGIVKVEDVRAALRAETVLITVMLANNEIGTIQPVAEIGQLVRDERAASKCHLWFHTDAVQAVGKIPIRLRETAINFLSLSAHKFHGPKGVGALYVNRRTRFNPLIAGGGQENGRRGGTENVAGIAGLGKAAELAVKYLEERKCSIRSMRDRFEKAILESTSGTSVNGAGALRIPNTSSLSFEGIESPAALILLDRHGLCCSAGSACKTGSQEASHVLRAMNPNGDGARRSLRFSFGRFNSEAEVDHAIELVPRVIGKLRQMPAPAPVATAL